MEVCIRIEGLSGAAAPPKGDKLGGLPIKRGKLPAGSEIIIDDIKATSPYSLENESKGEKNEELETR